MTRANNNGHGAITKGVNSMSYSKRFLAERLERIEYALADIREVLRNYPADTTHPYVAEKLAERDGYLTEWQTVTARLGRALAQGPRPRVRATH